jgi:hypothetical protein
MSKRPNRVTDLDDPIRCQRSTGKGQCPCEAQPGSDFCAAHERSSQRADKMEKRLYLLSRAADRARLAELSEHESIKSLREEISLLRMLIERRFEAIRDDNDLQIAFAPLASAFQTVERLVKSCHQIEENLGSLLSKSTLLKLGQSLSTIIVEELENVAGYEEIADRINERLIQVIAEAVNVEEP